MAICRRCRRPIHPLSRFAILGIGPECIKKENQEEILKFMRDMNIHPKQSDLEYAFDLNSANDTEVDDKKIVMRMLKSHPDINEMLKDSSNSTLFVPEMEKVQSFDVKWSNNLTIRESGIILLDIAEKEGEDLALEVSRRQIGRANEDIRKKGLKRYLKENETRG